MNCSVFSASGLWEGIRGEGRIGIGFLLMYSWIASRPQFSVLLNPYLWDIQAMAISWSRLAEAELVRLSSAGLCAAGQGRATNLHKDVQSID